MSGRFIALNVIAVLFTLACVAAALIAIAGLVNAKEIAGEIMGQAPFTEQQRTVVTGIIMAGASSLILFSCAGFILAGIARVLIAIEENTRKSLPARTGSEPS